MEKKKKKKTNSSGMRVQYGKPKENYGVRVHLEEKSNGVRVHFKKKKGKEKEMG